MSGENQLPRQAGPYVLLAELGRGGMGRVLLGVTPDGRPAAVKLVHARHAAEPDFRARFRREVAASRRVSGAYTAAVLDADPDAEQPWLASVFVAGPSLAAAVGKAGALPGPALHRLAVGLATALTEIHQAGLVHRDLKPENVLLAEDGARVIDFGIARAAEGRETTELTGTGWVIGSPQFMSPEQADGRELTAASDVFSLGSVLVLAATGHSPFAGPSVLQTLYNVVHAEPDLTALPAALHGIVARCLAKQPADRPTPAELLALLGPVPPSTEPWPPAVQLMVGAQRARAEQLLSGGAEYPAPPTAAAPPTALHTVPDLPTPPPLPRPPLQLMVGAQRARAEQLLSGGAEYPAPPTAAAPPTALRTVPDLPAPLPRPRAPRQIRWWVVGGLFAAGLGIGGYLMLSQKGGGSEPPDAYYTMPTCAQMAPVVPMKDQLQADKGSDTNIGNHAKTECHWFPTAPLSQGDPVPAESGIVSWEMFRSTRAQNGTRAAEQDFAGTGNRPETGLGFGDQADWLDATTTGPKCQLNVRAGNLVIRVYLKRDTYPDCEASARDVARATLAAIPAGV
ncbi:serine/threonine-protein kinase [Kitasatospora griseola]|uniref:serine/threonine-protein kinase n=1 Tax=Kitasatospora griseola TaxID=2064 RepID=UPI00385583C2